MKNLKIHLLINARANNANIKKVYCLESNLSLLVASYNIDGEPKQEQLKRVFFKKHSNFIYN